MGKIARKYLAHYIDASFGGTTTNDVRLGTDLEEYNEEMNPEVDTKINILGEQTVNHSGYQVESEVDPYYAVYDDPLWEKLQEIANKRMTGDQCKTTKVDVLLTETGTVIWAYREDVLVIPNSIGGDTSGVQIPFTVHNDGNRVSGTWTMSSKKFVESAS